MTQSRNIDDLDVYLVGGAVRDTLLGRAIGDRDWVVVGSSAEDMLALGFSQVGRDFPVFLHPETAEEYALARTERKQGAGHTGFIVHADPEVMLEEDLKRRDLTINAIAQSPAGDVFDPFGGVADLQAGRFRHVSPAFAEDPLRILRVARFAAQLPEFDVADATLELMRDMCAADALVELSAERVWQEFAKALSAQAPERFFFVLEACDGLSPWFSELADRDWHFSPSDAKHRFADLPLSGAALEAFAHRVKVPKQFLEAATDWHRWGDVIANARSADASVLVDALENLRALHESRRLEFVIEHVSLTSKSDERWLLDAVQDLAAVKPQGDLAPGPAYGKALAAARVARLEVIMEGFSASGEW